MKLGVLRIFCEMSVSVLHVCLVVVIYLCVANHEISVRYPPRGGVYFFCHLTCKYLFGVLALFSFYQTSGGRELWLQPVLLINAGCGFSYTLLFLGNSKTCQFFFDSHVYHATSAAFLTTCF